MTLDDCEEFFSKIKAAKSLSEACYLLGILFEHYELMTVEYEPREITFWRARLAEKKPWDKMSEMGCPPVGKTPVNSLNDEGKPCFYGATSIDTALVEIGANNDQFVQVAGFRMLHQAPLRIAKVGEFYHVYKRGYLKLSGNDPKKSIQSFLNSIGRQHGERILFIDAFLASLLADSCAKSQDYILTRAIAGLIYRDQDIDGIIFPSVQDTLGMNLALLPESFDNKIRMVSCFHAKIKRKRKFGFMKYQVLSEIEQLDEFGNPIWLVPKSVYERRYFNLTEKECLNAASMGLI